MKKSFVFLLLICIATVLVVGCTNTSGNPSTVTHTVNQTSVTTTGTIVSVVTTQPPMVMTVGVTTIPTETPKDISPVVIDSTGEGNYILFQADGYRIYYAPIYTWTPLGSGANKFDNSELSRILVTPSQDAYPISISANGVRYIPDSIVESIADGIKEDAARRIADGEGPATNGYAVIYYLSDAKVDPDYYIINGNPARHIVTALKQPGILSTEKSDLYIISNGRVAYYVYYLPYSTAGEISREIGQQIIQTFAITP
jgi:hypothetical protein